MARLTQTMKEMISKEELCALTGLSDRRHRQLAEHGYFPAPKKGEYQKDPTKDGFIRYQREMLAKKDDAEEKLLKKAKREIAQEELAIIRRQYVLKTEIGPALRNLTMHFRAALQRKFENEVGPNLSGLKTPEILTRIKRAVDEMFQLLREGTKGWMDQPPTS
jgi:hypothetical protein